MNITALKPASHAAGDIPPERLADHKGLTESEKIAEASRQFEAVLLRQILTDARKPIFNSRLTEKSATSGIYDEMVTSQLANAISRSGEFGLARSLATELKPAQTTTNPNVSAPSDSTRS